jgi:phage terminase large subunit GpA-like protein
MLDFAGAADLVDAWCRGRAPEPLLAVSDWADRHRVLGSRGSAEPGRWRTERTPYLRDVMDALSPSHPARRVVLMKGSQVGGTEAGNNWIGYVIAHAPGPMMAVQPTTDLAKRFSEQRIDPLIDETEILRRIVAPARSRDSGNRQLSKEFPGGVLVMTGANSAVGLRSMPARFLFLDEVDAYPGDVDGEGDPVALADRRANTFSWRKKVFLVSTPLIAGRSRIEREYDASDRRRFFVPCPHCGHMQWLRFERLRWEKGAADAAAYACEECDEPIAEGAKTAMLAAGEWRPTQPSQDPHTIGFHLSALYSPVGWLSWGQIAREWEAAQGNIEALRAFRNTILGEPWMERGDAPDWERLIERREEFPLGIVPARALALTAGADVQKDRIEVSIWAWGRGMESWLVAHETLDGSPAEAAPWEALKRVLDRPIPAERGRAMHIERLAVDTGGQFTAEAYAHIRRMRDPRVLAVKGVEGWNRAAPVAGPTPVDVTEGGRRIRRGIRLWTVATATLKAETYRWLWLARPTPEDIEAGAAWLDGWIHIPAGAEPEWVKQLVAEELVSVNDRRGFARQEWRKLRERNEALDCRVYARAALWVLGADRHGAKFWERREAARDVEADDEPPAPPPEGDPLPARAGWVPEPPPAAPMSPLAMRPAPRRRVIASGFMA